MAPFKILTESTGSCLRAWRSTSGALIDDSIRNNFFPHCFHYYQDKREKITTQFGFPLVLDMAPFTERPATPAPTLSADLSLYNALRSHVEEIASRSKVGDDFQLQCSVAITPFP